MASYNIKLLVRDIERALEQAEAQTSAILRTAADAIISISSGGLILSYNAAAERMFGYSAEEMLGTNVSRLMPSPYANEHDNYLRNYLTTGKARIIGIGRETIARKKSGEEFPIDLSVSEVSIGDERTFTGIVRDLSEKRKAEGLQAFLASLVESSVDAIVGKDLSGRIISWNNSAESLYGYSSDEMIGQHISKIIPAEQRSEIEQILRTLTEEKRVVRIDTVRLARSGRRIDVSLSISPIFDSAGRVIGASSISRDITELKTYMHDIENARAQIEAQALELTQRTHDLERAQVAAERANRTKSEFLANMSHEIRTPLTAILGFAEVVRQELATEEKYRDVTDYLEAVSRNGEYLLRLIDDILDLSKIEAGRVDLEIIPTSPHELLREVHDMLLPRAKDKGIAIDLVYQTMLPATVSVDPTRLRQILLNIASNAIKFTNVGKVRIVTKIRGATGPRPRWDISVEDTGIGMNSDQIQRIFNPFVQGDNSTRRKFGGTGLGLAISKRLAESMGGNIRVESIPTLGSRFTVCVPLGSLGSTPLIAEPTRTTSASTADESSNVPRKGLRILLAEDGIDNQRLIAHLLKIKAKAKVTIVENGELAVEASMRAANGDSPFDVVLMDMQMPVMDGYEATRRLRRLGYQRSIVAITAHAMADDRQKCLDAGCDEFITKPINVKNLLSVLADQTQSLTSPEASSTSDSTELATTRL
jgi:PAS domain S-box-containing protein